MKKKVVSLCIAMLLAFGFAGCGKDSDAQTPSPTPTQTAATQTDTPAPAVEDKKPEDYPTLVWMMPGDPLADLDLINEEASKITREKIGANIEMRIIDWGAYPDRLNMNMAASAEFDLCFVGFLYPYMQAVDMGGLLEIGSLLDEHAKELVADMPDYVRQAVTTKSGIYAIPNVQIMAFGAGRYLRSDLQAKYNFDLSGIKKLADMEPILEVIRDNEPDVVPISKVEAHMFRDDGDANYISINSFLVNLNDKDNKVYAYYEIPGAKEAAAKSYDWYQKGFYRSDLATVATTGGDDEYYKTGRYASIETTYKPGVESEIKAGTGTDYTFIYNEDLIMGHTSPTETCIAVSRTSKNPAEAVKFINLVNTDKEFYNLVCFGIEGQHYTWVDDDHISLIPDSGYMPNSAWKMGNQFNAYLMDGQPLDSWDMTKDINNSAIKSPIIGISFDLDEVMTEMTQLSKVQNEYLVARINTGVEDPDTYWDDYVKAMQDAGIEKVKAVFQAQIDEFLSR